MTLNEEYEDALGAVLNLMLIDCASRHVRNWAIEVDCPCREEAQRAIDEFENVIRKQAGGG